MGTRGQPRAVPDMPRRGAGLFVPGAGAHSRRDPARGRFLGRKVTRLPWQAPRTAYLFTAAVAAADKAAADALWDALDHAAQTDTLTALAAQAKNASTAMRAGTALGDDHARRFGTEACEKALEAMTALLASPPAPWELPECSHCRRLLATAIASFSVRMARQRGQSAEVFAHSCRETAARTPRT
jgi:hypothetical protein